MAYPNWQTNSIDEMNDYTIYVGEYDGGIIWAKTEDAYAEATQAATSNGIALSNHTGPSLEYVHETLARRTRPTRQQLRLQHMGIAQTTID